MRPATLLVALVEEIKARASAPRASVAQVTEDTEIQDGTVDVPSEGEREEDSSDEEEQTESEQDNFLEELDKPYESVLRFLWMLHHRPSDIQAPAVGILEDPELVAWDAEVDGLIQPEAPPVTPAP